MGNTLLSRLRLRKLFYIAKLKRLQRLNDGELARQQESRLRKIIRHAYTHVPYYRELFDSAHIRPEDINTLLDLKNIPVLTKTDIRNNYPHKMVAKNVNLDDCYISSTTGSTGIPLQICFSPKDRDYFYACNNYVNHELGVKFFDKIVTVRHSPTIESDSWRNKLNFLDRKNISIFSPLPTIIERLNSEKPDVVFTYPSLLSLLAHECGDDIVSQFKPRLMITTGETMTDAMQSNLSDTFGSDILQFYASEEFGPIAFQCSEHRGYHVITDNVALEILKEGKEAADGETGEVIVTGLSNYSMPLIRYKLGDFAVVSHPKCQCGRNLPMVKHFVGRQDDYILLPSGKKISPRTINVIEEIPGISSYKTIQEARDRIRVQIVKNRHFSENTIDEVIRMITVGCLGENVSVDVEIVDAIPKERTGKLRAVVSHAK